MDIDKLIDGVMDSYEKYGGINRSGAENFPNRQNVVSVLQDLQFLIFPGFKYDEDINAGNLRYITGMHINRIISVLTSEIQKALVFVVSQNNCDNDDYDKSDVENSHCYKLAEKVVFALITEIPELRRKIQLDVQAAVAGDPAAKSNEEVILSYPGLEAIVVYRIAHFLHKNGVAIIPRIMSEHVHGKTGIDILLSGRDEFQSHYLPIIFKILMSKIYIKILFGHVHMHHMSLDRNAARFIHTS